MAAVRNLTFLTDASCLLASRYFPISRESFRTLRVISRFMPGRAKSKAVASHRTPKANQVGRGWPTLIPCFKQ